MLLFSSTFVRLVGNSIYNVHKVSLRLQLPGLNASGSGVNTLEPPSYAPEILQSQAVVLDIDNDDLYLPGKMDVPGFPRACFAFLPLV